MTCALASDRHMQEQEVPEEEQIDAVVTFLQDTCGLKEADIPKAVKTFPQVFGCDVEHQLQYAVNVLQKEYHMSGKVLTMTVKQRPQSLGCNVDCSGDCWGKCDRCWVRF